MLVTVLIGSSGCANYVTPGPGADLNFVRDPDIRERLKRRPEATFPVRLAVVRIQDTGYRSYTSVGHGTGNYSVVTTREVEEESHLERLQALPQIQAVMPVTQLLLPRHLKGERELRVAAASLHADILLTYTLNTSFRIADHDIGPLGTISLGFLPNQEARVICTASAVITDVRTGFVYGVAEATGRASQSANHWNSHEAVDQSRLQAEKESFELLIGELEKAWREVVDTHVQPDLAP